ncbi:GNAT family N-acetyltransferase [Thioclava sp. GXIMD2076]|uniref:GNAT family N-acetyltransferase n=1 Tax=Thioclava kandeliae TaxID=3070818 RepID=A0ABV1SG74_9RHOB
MVAPVLHTERLTLRPHDMSDFPAFAEVMKSARAAYMGGPHDVKAAWFHFASDVAQWALKGCGALAVVRKSDRQVVGQVALNDLPHFPERELGWIAFTGFEGQGYMTEAARKMRDFAALELHWKRPLVSYITPGNARSVALAERIGATLDRDALPAVPGQLVYRHPMGGQA